MYSPSKTKESKATDHYDSALFANSATAEKRKAYLLCWADPSGISITDLHRGLKVSEIQVSASDIMLGFSIVYENHAKGLFPGNDSLCASEDSVCLDVSDSVLLRAFVGSSPTLAALVTLWPSSVHPGHPPATRSPQLNNCSRSLKKKKK